MVCTVQVPWNNSLTYNFIPSSMERNCGEVPSPTQGFSTSSTIAWPDWFHHLPLVLLGIRSVPREDSPISPSEAVYGSPIVLPCEFLDSPELPSPEYFRRIQQIIKNTPVAPPHHNSAPPCSEPAQVPPSLLRSTHVFVREDASKPPLSPLYRAPYLVVSRTPKYFSLQVGSKTDSVSVDKLKPVLSEFPVTTQEAPRRGRPPSPVPPQPGETLED